MADFGNACYNDHHYHYGYFIHAGAQLHHGGLRQRLLQRPPLPLRLLHPRGRAAAPWRTSATLATTTTITITATSSTRARSCTMADFGNACYNDHHYHYGYFIHA